MPLTSAELRPTLLVVGSSTVGAIGTGSVVNVTVPVAGAYVVPAWFVAFTRTAYVVYGVRLAQLPVSGVDVVPFAVLGVAEPAMIVVKLSTEHSKVIVVEPGEVPLPGLLSVALNEAKFDETAPVVTVGSVRTGVRVVVNVTALGESPLPALFVARIAT